MPYRFFGLTEQLSWLAQFAGQGFEDISALANLIMLQEMMLGEEYQLIAGSVQPDHSGRPDRAPSAPRSPTRSRSAPRSTDVEVSAMNYFGATAVSAATAVTVAAGQVVDVTICPASRARCSTTSTALTSAHVLPVGTVGGVKVHAAGRCTAAGVADPAGGGLRHRQVHPDRRRHPDPDRPVGRGRDLPDHADSGRAATTTTPSAPHLSYNAIYTALKALWDSTATSRARSRPTRPRSSPPARTSRTCPRT